MIFAPHLVHQILAGKATQTRRPANPIERKDRFKVGQRHVVQKAHIQPGELHIIITDAHVEPLDRPSLTIQDARAMGYQTTDDFRAHWVRLHDKPWVQRLEATTPTSVDLEPELWARFHNHHAGRDTWALTFQIDRTEQPRLLAARSDELYVTNPHRALPDEPEAVDPATQRRITDNANRPHHQWKLIETIAHEQAALTNLLAYELNRAQAAGVDVRRQEIQIRQRINAMRRKIDSKAA